MRKQTKKLQEQWIKKHLNGGEFPQDEKAYKELLIWGLDSELACLEALRWLESAKPDITTLAEAWDRCPRPDWMVWAVSKIPRLSKAEVKLLVKAAKKVGDYCFDRNHDVGWGVWTWDNFNAQVNYAEKALQSGDLETACFRLNRATYMIFGYWFDDNYTRSAKDNERLPSIRARTRHAAELFRQIFPNPWR